MAVTGSRVLVTGGAGFVGMNVARALTAGRLATRCYDDFLTGQHADADAVGYAEIVEGDVLDAHALGEAARKCTHIVDRAAHSGAPASVEDPERDGRVNVGGTLNAVQAARRVGVRSFVLASSNAPLGPIEPPAHERVIPWPKSPYGASKLAGEAYCSAFSGSYGVPMVALRFANVCGPYGYHKGSVIAAFCKAALAGDPLWSCRDTAIGPANSFLPRTSAPGSSQP